MAPGRLGIDESRQPPSAAITNQRTLNDVVAGTRGESYAPLPYSEREVAAIARLFEDESGNKHASVLLGAEASEQAVDGMATRGELRRYRHLLFSTHAEMDNCVAMHSALILAHEESSDPIGQILRGEEVYDGRLTAQQIARTWQLSADLVTLSACRTALGKDSGGEGYLGFSQALFVAGARSVVLSLWDVDDTATMLLMVRFYENLLGEYGEPRGGFVAGTRMPKGEALREAKRWLRSSPPEEIRAVLDKWELRAPSAARAALDERPSAVPRPQQERYDFSHPYYWAAFILIGDPD